MANAQFYVGNFAVILSVIFLLGNMGMADDVYGDEFAVYDSNEGESEPDAENTFDIDKIRFTPDFYDPEQEENIEEDILGNDDLKRSDGLDEIGEHRYAWDGSTWEDDNGEEFSEGRAQYDVSDRDGNYTVSYYDVGSWGFSSNVGVYLYETADDDSDVEEIDFTEGTREKDQYTLDLSGEEYGFDSVETAEFYSSDEDSWFDLSGSVEGGTGGATSALTDINAFLSNGYSYVSEVPKMAIGYIEFTLALPGLIGTFMRLYIGLLLFVFAVVELWIG